MRLKNTNTEGRYLGNVHMNETSENCSSSVLYKQGSMSPKTPNPISPMRLITTNIGSDTIGQQTRSHIPEGNKPKGDSPKTLSQRQQTVVVKVRRPNTGHH